MFNVSGSFSFVIPQGVSTVRATAMGGGGGASNGHQPGGGGGFVNCSNVSVSSGQTISVTVGAGGTGAGGSGNDPSGGNTNGAASSFGSYLVAAGGSTCGLSGGQMGCAGGTGSGANCGGACVYNLVGGSGGAGGNDGYNVANTAAPFTTPGGQGQGVTSYMACLNLAKLHQLSAGAGGAGGLPWTYGPNSWSASGGGGGVLLDGNGPAAQNGMVLYTAHY